MSRNRGRKRMAARRRFQTQCEDCGTWNDREMRQCRHCGRKDAYVRRSLKYRDRKVIDTATGREIRR